MELVELRKKTGLSQAKFAAKFNIPLNTYFHWEQGRHKPPQYVVDMISMMLEQENKKSSTNQVPVDWLEKQIDNLSVKQHCYRQMHQGEEDATINAIGSFMRGLIEEWQNNCQ